MPCFRDVYDHLLRVSESVEANREYLGHVLDAHQWTVSQRTNLIMKRLTIISAVFLPLSFITGWFGQNCDYVDRLTGLDSSSLIVDIGILAIGVFAFGLSCWLNWKEYLTDQMASDSSASRSAESS